MLNSLPATISKVSTMEKNIIRIVVDSQELHQDDAAELFRLKGNQGWFYFHEAPIKEVDTKDLPELPSPTGSPKRSKSQEYRAKLYIYWQQQGIGGSFESFYDQRMTQLIKQIEEKLL